MLSVKDCMRTLPQYQKALDTLLDQRTRRRPLPALLNGLCEGAKFAFYASFVQDWKKKTGQGVFLLCAEEKQLLRLQNAFSELGLRALSYPLRDFVFYNMTASHEYEQERMRALKAIADKSYDVILATPDAAAQLTMPKSVLQTATRTVSVGDTCEPDALVAFLQENGYIRTDMVDGAGQYAQRGGIVDVFAPQAIAPVRIDFFDTEIERISTFDIMTQRRTDDVEQITLIPTREVLLTAQKKTELRALIAEQRRKARTQALADMLAGELAALDHATDLAFLDKYLTCIYPESTCLLDYADADTCICIEEDSAVRARVDGYTASIAQSIEDLLQSGAIPSRYALYCRSTQELYAYLDRRPCAFLELFSNAVSRRELSGMYHFLSKQTVSYFGRPDLLFEDLSQYRELGYSCQILCETEGAARELQQQLLDGGVQATLSVAPDAPGRIAITYGQNFAPFELTEASYACLSTYQNPNSLARALRSSHRRATKKKTAQEQIMSYADLQVGDYVVHIHHGIGRYLGLQTLTVSGTTREFVKLQYAGTDTLYLPCDQLDTLSKYIGSHAEDGNVKLSRIGGEEWGRAKAKAKGAAKEMAKELIALYAARMRREGHAFPPDDAMQQEFESAFAYEETDGQLQAAADIKRDMEQPRPMERLLCGDVGFGKTEVALRAAFKAVAGGKQVAVLVPTTILAMQHFGTFSARMQGFPVRVDVLSRFRTPKQQQESLRKLARGETDVIIGTHRLLSEDVSFRDLGLVIVDEEQRFGVSHKEKLKQLSQNIDALTLTATPIPRTLNMAMSGIRDMSILEEAPLDRMPVQSYVLEYEDSIVAEAIRRELRRGGQVFYLYNKVETILDVAARLRRQFPDATVAVAHGQMDREEISDIWSAMVDGSVDILISTTIIETGIDIPHANTLIIEHADAMGLSQLHQLRGRIGRSSRRAYAYFTYPKSKVLTEIAAKRLSAIREYTEFGSGFKVALRDLEIRGAGNLLGAQQHGHITTIGYDLYMKLLSEAVLEEQGKHKEPPPECTVSLSVNAYLPESFIATTAQRIDAYKRISLIRNADDLMDVTDELLDRYGDIPKPVENLLDIAALRAAGQECGLSKIEEQEGNILLRAQKFEAIHWMRLAAEFKGRLLLNVGAKPYVAVRQKKGEAILPFLRQLLRRYLAMRAERTEAMQKN